LVSDGEHYRLSRKTDSRKGEQMKRIALLSVVSLMLVTVFAPVAMAQEPGEVDVQSVTLGPGGSVTVNGTIQCVEGQRYDWGVNVRQRTSGNVFLGANVGEGGTCENTGSLKFTFTTFGRVSGDGPEKPFHKGQATVQTFGRLCSPDFSGCTPNQESIEQVRIS
jgi:hypothetical protein